MSEPEFNWYTELDKAINEEPTEEKYLYLFKRSGDWVTCACGELCKALPKDRNGQPEDLQLYKMGVDFTNCILAKHWHQALGTLNQIEARTAKLLNEQK